MGRGNARVHEWPGWLLALVLLVGGSVGVFLGTSLVRWQDAWANRRAQRARDRGEAERRRRWAEEDHREAIRRQLHELEAQVREEQRSHGERAWWRQYQEREAAITREARRRLGLPEEAGDEEV